MRKMLLATTAALGLTGLTTNADALERWLDVHNDSSSPLCVIFISHVDANYTGPNLTGDTCVPPGEMIRVDPGWQQGYCMMNIVFAFADGDLYSETYYNICEESDIYLEDDEEADE